MDKLWEYIRNLPHLLVVGKILICQAIPYHKPTPNSAMTVQLWEAQLMDEGQFAGNFGSSMGYSQIVASGHPWLSLKSVEIHVWMCKPGEGPINVDSSHQAGYAFRTIFLTVDLDSANNALSRGHELTKEAILELNVPDVDQQSLDRAVFWTPMLAF
ncbi:hypothetical protein SCLCIDRAFT_26730 [Scleroderma citrinum Foug A]|uniref:Uncharacterized protein n=1 Tax=Scleroderma citrinum Foug A TaxID=1036808 RepID=A0A0C3DWD0_9AGAM|nr:hypothetical protein SCLCIDRAFT_26730 [Scleroderma citrinum Foug A]